ncbi:UDP-N-acetylmuramate--L-alanine ligase [bacterium AH-315-P15]|nr:UDP-N-acetylmuramate--L-alanine ligase [bacterium AH-315-P15]
MARLPLDIGTLHFVGIGGIGMSGIAEVMHNLGYDVRGSDLTANGNVRRLQGLGINVAVGQKAENVEGAHVVVISSAIKEENSELQAARAASLPIVRRAEMLAELMRLKFSIAVGGTHGKTTTTSLIAALLDAGHFDPTVINGGILNTRGTNAYLGQGEWMVVEADESDGTFVKLPATAAVVTNIDPEHLDHYGSFEAVKAAFLAFAENVPFYGFIVLCIDDPDVQALLGQIENRRLITYGFSPQADVRGVDISFNAGVSHFSIEMNDRVKGGHRRIEALTLPMPGEHNISNAIAAIVVANELGLPEDVIKQGLATFSGVKRRFTHVGTWNSVTIIDDYGHHPVEIAAVLKAARGAGQGRILAVVQPHRYSRLHDLFEEFCTCFNDADAVIVADVYEAGERAIEGVNKDALVEGLRRHGHKDVTPLPDADALAGVIRDQARPGDMVVCLGAGSITLWAHDLPGQLAQLSGSAANG